MQVLEPEDPRSIGDYRLLGRLGAGGMGQVYAGVSPGGRVVAVKVVRHDLVRLPQFHTRFRREVLANRLVSGAFTAPVIDSDVDASPPWLVTSYIPGPSLQQTIVDSGPLPATTVLALAAGLAEALKSIHDAGLVHRDLKPSNVLLAEDGPRVIDFGIARISEATSITGIGDAPGTPGFMSPEQVNSDEITWASDVFSLGVVLACAATGANPFRAGRREALYYQIVHAEPDLAGITEPVLHSLIADCLAKAPESRPTLQEIIARVGFGYQPTKLLDVAAWSPAADRARAHEQTMALAETVSRHTMQLAARSQDAIPPGPPGRGASMGMRQDAPRGRTRRTVVLSAFATLVAAGVPTGIYLTRDTTPEPVAVWPLDERRGAKIAKDTAGRYSGAQTSVDWGKGSGGAALFNGHSSRVATAEPVLKTGQGHSYTVSAWARLDTLDTTAEFATVVSQSAGDLTAFFLQYWATPNRWAFSGPKDEFRVQSSVKAVPRHWTHLVGVCDRGALALYVDRKQVGSDDSVDVAVAESKTDQLIIGGAGLSREYGDTYKDFFPGSIKDVRVFDQALTSDEIKALG